MQVLPGQEWLLRRRICSSCGRDARFSGLRACPGPEVFRHICLTTRAAMVGIARIMRGQRGPACRAGPEDGEIRNKAGSPKPKWQKRSLGFRVFDLFRISCFGFRISDFNPAPGPARQAGTEARARIRAHDAGGGGEIGGSGIGGWQFDGWQPPHLAFVVRRGGRRHRGSPNTLARRRHRMHVQDVADRLDCCLLGSRRRADSAAGLPLATLAPAVRAAAWAGTVAAASADAAAVLPPVVS